MGACTRIRILVLLLAGAAVACGDGGPTPPTCAEDEVAIEGIIDGEEVSERMASNGWSWLNLPSDTDNAYMDVYGPDSSIVVHMEWGRLIAHDQGTGASGWVDLSGQGGLAVGNCEDDGFVSQITSRDRGADFYLQDLHRSPYCGGDLVEGYLVGCVRIASSFPSN